MLMINKDDITVDNNSNVTAWTASCSYECPKN